MDDTAVDDSDCSELAKAVSLSFFVIVLFDDDTLVSVSKIELTLLSLFDLDDVHPAEYTAIAIVHNIGNNFFIFFTPFRTLSFLFQAQA